MGPPSEVTGGIFQDLASFAIFFDLRWLSLYTVYGQDQAKTRTDPRIFLKYF